MTKSTNTETQAKTITIDNVDYDLNTFSQEQLLLVNHCMDLTNKINAATFQLQQLTVAKDSFLDMLKKSLKEVKK